MAYALCFSRDVTALINSYWDWRYRLVRNGGKTPSASAMPLPIPPHRVHEPITANMEHGQYYMQRIESSYVDGTPFVNINIWLGSKPRILIIYDPRQHHPIKRFHVTFSPVSPCDLVALYSTRDACEPAELEDQRTCF